MSRPVPKTSSCKPARAQCCADRWRPAWLVCLPLAAQAARAGRASTKSTSTSAAAAPCRMPCARRWCAPPGGARPPTIRRSRASSPTPRSYVKSYATGPRGQTQVVFDGAAVERAVTAAGRSVWDRERPFTLVVLDPPRPRAAAEAARAQLERVAAERGLPISVIPLHARRCRRRTAGREALLQAAQRYGGDQCWSAAATAAAADGELQWTLYTRARARAGAARSPPASTMRSICWRRSRAARSPQAESERARRDRRRELAQRLRQGQAAAAGAPGRAPRQHRRRRWRRASPSR